MREVRVGVWQFEPVAGEPEQNLSKLEQALESKDAEGLDLLVAPEMFLSGWEPRFFNERNNADPGWAGRVARLAKRAGIGIAASLLTTEQNRFYNTFHLWASDGRLLGIQNKIHLWDKEAQRLTPGQAPQTIEAPFARIGGLVCYDVEFPEVCRSLALDGAELFLVPSAFYSPHSWDVMTRARALENGCFLAAANQIGGEPGNPHNGQSRIVDPFGNVLAEVPPKTTGIARARLDPTRITAARAWAPFLRDLRLGPKHAAPARH